MLFKILKNKKNLKYERCRMEGYRKASDIYSKKFLEQQEIFEQEKERYKQVKVEMDMLLDKYDNEIVQLISINERTEEENKRLLEVLMLERTLYSQNKKLLEKSISNAPKAPMEVINIINASLK